MKLWPAQIAVLSAAGVLAVGPVCVQAHNYPVHRDMTDLAYEIMIAVATEIARPVRDSPLLLCPENVPAPEWDAFLAAVVRGRDGIRVLRSGLQSAKQPKCAYTDATPGTSWAFDKPLKDMPSPVRLDWFTGNDCGVDAGWAPTGFYREYNARQGERTDFSGEVLGFWSATIDDHKDDTHLWYKPTSMAGAGAAAIRLRHLRGIRRFGQETPIFGLRFAREAYSAQSSR
jgi:hypothetical protein